MNTSLKIDFNSGVIEVQGEEEFVKKIYADFKEQISKQGLPKKVTTGVDKKNLPDTEIDNYGSLGEFISLIDNGKATMTESLYALITAYYLQTKNESDVISGIEINKELKHTGNGIKNITRAIDHNIQRKPQLMIQIKKGGKTKQARKEYRVTDAGKDTVRALLKGEYSENEE